MVFIYLIHRLQLVQNCAARVVMRRSKYEHIKPILLELHWLPVSQRILFKILLLTYKALNGLAPAYISDLLSRYIPARQLRSSTQFLLKVPTSNLKTLERFQFVPPNCGIVFHLMLD